MKLALFTPTAQRPESFSLLERWIAAQTRQPDCWIVAVQGDGYSFNCNQQVITVPLHEQPGPSMRANWLAAIPQLLDSDAVICAEDDDYYSPGYFELMAKLVTLPGVSTLAGLSYCRYYHIARGYLEVANPDHSALAATAFTRDLLGIVKDACHSGRDNLDAALWDNWRGQKVTTPNTIFDKPLNIGVKGLYPAAVSGGHNPQHFHADAEYRMLRRWLADPALSVYISVCNYYRQFATGFPQLKHALAESH